jgi:hypothetical protein
MTHLVSGYPLLHQTPVVRLGRRFAQDFRPSKPYLDRSSPSNASGLASNAFRRNAAHISGKHATPASFSTISGRGYSSTVERVFQLTRWP